MFLITFFSQVIQGIFFPFGSTPDPAEPATPCCLLLLPLPPQLLPLLFLSLFFLISILKIDLYITTVIQLSLSLSLSLSHNFPELHYLTLQLPSWSRPWPHITLTLACALAFRMLVTSIVFSSSSSCCLISAAFWESRYFL